MSHLLLKIRQDLEKEKIDGVIISRSDPFLSGYYPPYKNRLKEVTGFSGSDGLAFISKEKKVLFVDSRYTEQAREQSDFEVLEVPRDARLSLWLKENMKDKTIAFDGDVHSCVWYETLHMLLKEYHIHLKPLKCEIISSWFKKKEFKQETFDYDLGYAGVSTKEKLTQIQKKLCELDLDAFLVLSPENASWILNKRSKKKSDYPVVYERLLVKKDASFCILNNHVDLTGLKVGVDFNKAPFNMITQLKEKGVQLKNTSDFVDDMKAQKNDVEIQNIKEACLFESAVICKFLVYVEKNKSKINEIDCDKKLKSLRKKSPLYFYDSFDAIAASGVHAALAHYMATKESAFFIKENPLLLVDTGGHYLNGTTDMTRTIVINEPTTLMKKRYTEVLKGHIGVSKSVLKSGESSASMDERAHAYLRADGVDFYHSTGHGIGMMLGVHEYPPAVYGKDEKGILPNMVFSNEPAFYSYEEKFGIRLENMLLSVIKDEKLIFENLLFIPFDYRAIDFDMLTQDEKEWLKQYHQMVVEKVFPYLTKSEQKVLTPFVEVFMKG